jgi:hypothetical protein
MKVAILRKVMVCANDRLEHDVVYSRMAEGWMLENKRDGLVSTHTTFAQAIAAMELAARFNSSGYSWTITDNPYWGD